MSQLSANKISAPGQPFWDDVNDIITKDAKGTEPGLMFEQKGRSNIDPWQDYADLVGFWLESIVLLSTWGGCTEWVGWEFVLKKVASVYLNKKLPYRSTLQIGYDANLLG